MRHALLSHLVLLTPDRVAEGLERVRAAGLVDPVPNVWQVTLGVLRMWHRVLYRSETIGQSVGHARRPGLRPRLLERRPLRFPFLLRERAVAPLDFSGLVSSRQRIVSHLLGAHHDKNQFVYDMQLLGCHPGALEEVERRAAAVVDGTDPRGPWLRDLAVFEEYHENLLGAVRAALAGVDSLTPEERDDPDVSFLAYLRWCAAQPATPAATLAAWRAGRLDLRSTTRAPPAPTGAPSAAASGHPSATLI